MKRALLIGLMILLLPGPAMAADEITVPTVEYDISQWEQLWQELPGEIKGLFGGLSPGKLIENYRQGKEGLFDFDALISAFKSSILDELRGMGALLGIVLAIGLTDMIIGGREGVGEMLAFCMMGLCVSFVTTAVYEQFTRAKETVESISRVTEITSPVMMTLVAACGSAGAAASQPATILLCNAITNGFKGLLMPLIPIMCGFTVAAGITGQGQLKSIAGLIKSLLKWIMGLTFTFFLGSVSIRGLNASGLDRAGIKAIKYAFDKSVPVVGSMISGTYDSLLAGAVVLKNAAGTAAVLLLILNIMTPALAMLSTIFALRIMAVLSSLLADGRVAGILEGAADSCTYMFAVMVTVALMNLITISASLIASGV